MRLWSWASGRARAVRPSHSASSEHSGPRHPLLEHERRRRRRGSRPRSSASSSGTVTPLPAASPSSLTTTGRPSARHHASAAVDVAGAEAGERRAGDAESTSPARGRSPSTTPAAASAAVGPKHGTPRRRAPVGGTGDERRLRAGDHEVERGRGRASSTSPTSVDVVAVAPARPGDRLLAPTAADDRDPHQASTPSKLSLAWRLADLQRVAAGEAGVAVAGLGAVVVADGPHHPLQREELEAVGADPLADLVERQAGRHQVAVVAHVDAEVARVHDRRARDPHVHLGRAGVADQLDERPGRRAAHERVVDHHDPLAGEVLAEGVELEGHAAVADLLRRLDERAADVAVLDQPVVERHAARPGVADGRRDRGVRHRDHDVGVDRRLGGQLGAEPLADVVHVAAVPHRVGPGEVDELERAAGLARRRRRAPGGGAARRRAA